MTTRRLYIAFASMTLAILAAAFTAQAQERPGIDRPIRVAMFRGTGPGTLWHTSIHTSHTVMASLLADPAASNLGDSLIIPPAGFFFRSVPTAAGTGGPDGTCGGQSSCRPDSAALSSWVNYIRDSADVMILGSATNFGRIVDTVQRAVIEAFWKKKGYVGVHGITDTKGTWPSLDSIHGTQFNNHPAEQIGTLRRDSAFQNDSAWQYLNRGIFSNGTDTAFVEEWFHYTNTGAEIRARPYLKPTTKLVESSLPNPNTNLFMGDHPHSWFRELPTGGRTFYTGLGHRAQVWQSTRAFRRQIYNAILWTAKYDSTVRIVALSPSRAPLKVSDHARLSVFPGSLKVLVTQDGSHTVELSWIDGRRIAERKGQGKETIHDFGGLRAGVYVVSVNSPAGRSRSLVTVR